MTEEQNEPQQETEQKSKTHRGRVKWFNPAYGHGFIYKIDEKDDEGNMKESFVYYSNINSGLGYKILTMGEYVEFEEAPCPNRKDGQLQAVNVRGINGGMLFNEYNICNNRSKIVTNYNGTMSKGNDNMYYYYNNKGGGKKGYNKGYNNKGKGKGKHM